MEIVWGFLLGALFIWAKSKFRNAAARKRAKEWDVGDYNNQRRFIEQTGLYSRKPVNKEAFNTVFAVAEKTLSTIQPKHRIFAEVSMGSFIRTSNSGVRQSISSRAFKSFNSKRVDFLVIDAFGSPALVIEYHGSGHNQGNAAERDEVKRLALKKAGIPLLEIFEGATKQEVENKVRYWVPSPPPF